MNCFVNESIPAGSALSEHGCVKISTWAETVEDALFFDHFWASPLSRQDAQRNHLAERDGFHHQKGLHFYDSNRSTTSSVETSASGAIDE